MRRKVPSILCLLLLTGCCCFVQTISGEITVGGGAETPVTLSQATLQLTLWVFEIAKRVAAWDIDEMPLDPLNGPFVLMWKLLRLALRTWVLWLWSCA